MIGPKHVARGTLDSFIVAHNLQRVDSTAIDGQGKGRGSKMMPNKHQGQVRWSKDNARLYPSTIGQSHSWHIDAVKQGRLNPAFGVIVVVVVIVAIPVAVAMPAGCFAQSGSKKADATKVL